MLRLTYLKTIDTLLFISPYMSRHTGWWQELHNAKHQYLINCTVADRFRRNMGKVFRFNSAASLMIHGGAEKFSHVNMRESRAACVVLANSIWSKNHFIVSRARECAVVVVAVFGIFHKFFKDKKVHAWKAITKSIKCTRVKGAASSHSNAPHKPTKRKEASIRLDNQCGCAICGCMCAA